jgi:hypothetical protein
MSVGFSHLNDAELETLHKSLHTDVANPAVLEAHHSVTTEILARGLEHGHEDDKWNRAVIELEIEAQIPVAKAIAQMPLDIAHQVIESLGNPEFVKKTTLLTVDGYTLKFDAFEKSHEVEMRLNETQKLLYETLEAVVDRVGSFDQGTGANGAHYMEKSPFAKEGMICANCVFYEGGQGCEIVTGLIDHMGLCKFWIIPEDLLDPSVRKHQAGKHDQESHGNWAGTSQMDKPESISFNGDAIKKGRDSMWEHLVPDGKGGYKLTAEREKLYDKIVKEHLKGITPTGNPTFTLMGGGGGSGKGTVQKNPIAMNQADQYGVKIPADNFVMVDPDEIKSMLPEFKYMVSIGLKEDAAGYTHEESSAIAKIIQRQAFSRGLDVLLDGTGNSKAIKLQSKIDQARDAGYTVNGAYVHASIENAWQRNMNRAVESETRGLVPAWAFLEAHKSVSDIIPYMAPKFDNWVLFDTNGAKGSIPPIIAVGHRGVAVQVIDRTAYREFIDKAFTKFTPDELDAMWDEFKVGKI